ncbi:MAG TPA: DUF4139 domain-containing protein, partial [Terriglobales bacterium]|nr:DUF4139 domain-containing protein [Terriglobales bacterium]
MRDRVSFLLVLFVLGGSAAAQRVIAAATPSASDRLPVRHVALYKNGIGYFEHDGKVHGNQTVTIAFTTSQLNDVLKSLTAIDLNGGRIADVSYNSTAPLEQRLNTLQLPIGEKTTTAEFLDALRGARVEVSSGSASVVGRLLSVETVTTFVTDEGKKGSEARSHTELSVITDSGELRTFLLSPATSVHLLESDLNQEVGRYLSLIVSTRAADVRKMTIATEGSGDRQLSVSYISEVPIWKSTYRIVLPSSAGQRPLLQGWAVVDNTVGEDWDNVELSLIAGAPQSFVQEISQPYYARRPVVGLPELATLTPQTHEGTLQAEMKLPAPPPPPPLGSGSASGVLGGIVSEPYGGPSKSRNFKGNGSGGGIGGVGAGVGGGFGGGVYARSDSPYLIDTPDGKSVTDLMESQQTTASAHDLGDVFEYKINQPVTIHKNQSALVPILQARIDAEKVTLWSPREPRPLRALWLTNSSGLTLDGGTFSIQEAQTFAGEGLMDAIRPGEKRLISYAADPAVQVKSEVKGEGQRATLVRIHRGLLFQESQEREHHRYIVRNQDASAREVVIEHPERKGWELAGGAKPEETSASAYRFRIKVDPAQSSSLEFDEVHSFGTNYALTNITPDQIAIFVRQAWVNDKIENALRPIIEQKNEVAGYDQKIASTKNKISAIFDDQKRLRENLAALKGGVEVRSLAERYTGELNREEDELATLRKDLVQLQVQHETANQKLNEMMEKLEL